MAPKVNDIASSDRADIAKAWADARAVGLNNRAVARKLGMSERQLIASACGDFVTRLRSEPTSLLAALTALGKIKCVVRNPWAVLERDGEIQAIRSTCADALAVEADRFRLDCQLGLWQAAFALEEAGKYGSKLSVQFFTAEGISAAKFFLRDQERVETFRALVEAYSASDQTGREHVAQVASSAYMPLERLVATRHDGLLRFLQAASAATIPLHLKVRNDAATLTTNKVIEQIKRSDRMPWVNVLDEGLDLHLHEDSLRYVRLSRDPDGDSGWFHWFSDRRGIALSVQVANRWSELTRTIAKIDP
jgi:putative heme degradation protein